MALLESRLWLSVRVEWVFSWALHSAWSLAPSFVSRFGSQALAFVVMLSVGVVDACADANIFVRSCARTCIRVYAYVVVKAYMHACVNLCSAFAPAPVYAHIVGVQLHAHMHTCSLDCFIVGLYHVTSYHICIYIVLF